MQNLEVSLVNLFMSGENTPRPSLPLQTNTTSIECEGFKFEFQQIHENLNQNDYINKSIITTIVTIENINSDQVEHLLHIIDDLCLLLSFAQQSPIRRRGYKIGSNGESLNCSAHLINPPAYIIDNNAQSIRLFIEKVYPQFKKLKVQRELTIVFGYLLEIHQPQIALETKLILSYVLIEHIKRTYAEAKGYIKKDNQFEHPNYPDLKTPPNNFMCYEAKKYRDQTYYRHKKFGKCGSNEMIRRTFEDIGINRERMQSLIDKRNQMIHEGILLPINSPQYFKQSFKDFRITIGIIKEYLLKTLGYKGEYFYSQYRLLKARKDRKNRKFKKRLHNIKIIK